MNTKISLLVAGLSVILLLNGGACDSTNKDGDPSLEAFLHDTPNNKSPIARAGADQTINIGDPVALDGSASTDSDGEIVKYEWKLLDGTPIGTGSTLTVSTAEFGAGTYTIVLVVTDDDEATGADALVITIKKPNTTPTPPPGEEPNQPPVADAGEEPNQPPVADAGDDQTRGICDAIVMDGTGSSDPDGTISTYVWTTSGGDVIGNGATPTLAMAGRTPGEHTITLTVTDDQGATDTDTVLVTVNGADEDYDFSYVIVDPNTQPASPNLSVTPDNARIFLESTFHFWTTTITNSTSTVLADPGIVNFDFSFPGNIELAYLYATVTTFHFSYSAGSADLFASNGGTEVQLLDVGPPAINGYNIGYQDGFLEETLMGTNELSIRAELHADGSSYTRTAQFLRWRQENNYSFKLNVCYEGEQPR